MFSNKLDSSSDTAYAIWNVFAIQSHVFNSFMQYKANALLKVGSSSITHKGSLSNPGYLQYPYRSTILQLHLMNI